VAARTADIDMNEVITSLST